MQIKFLNSGFNSASYNFAVDEAILEWVKENKVPVLRFYGFKPTACTIGYFQGMEMEIDVKQALEANIECVRRLTGGGAVMHDQNQFTYSLIIPEELVAKNILESYEQICNGLINGLKGLGLDCEFSPLNDIVLDGQKISGNAQTRKGGVVLQHGTLLLEVDVDLMFSLLKVPDEKMKDKLIKSVKKRVTGVNRHLEHDLDFDSACTLFLESFTEEFKFSSVTQFDLDSLEDQIKMLQDEKYGDRSWNFKY